MLKSDVQKGIRLADRGRLDDAIAVYDDILGGEPDPYSIAFYFEKAYALSAQDLIGNQVACDGYAKRRLSTTRSSASIFTQSPEERGMLATDVEQAKLQGRATGHRAVQTFAFACVRI